MPQYTWPCCARPACEYADRGPPDEASGAWLSPSRRQQTGLRTRARAESDRLRSWQYPMQDASGLSLSEVRSALPHRNTSLRLSFFASPFPVTAVSSSPSPFFPLNALYIVLYVSFFSFLLFF